MKFTSWSRRLEEGGRARGRHVMLYRLFGKWKVWQLLAVAAVLIVTALSLSLAD